MLATSWIVVLVSSALAVSPWPIEARARVVATVQDPSPVIPSPPAEPPPTPDTPAPTEPAPAQPSPSPAPAPTKPTPIAPTPTATSIPQPEPTPTKTRLRDLPTKQRRMVIAAYALTGAAAVPVAFEISSFVMMLRAKRRFDETDPNDVDRYEARRHEVLRQGHFVLAAAAVGIALCTTALVLVLVARRQYKRHLAQRSAMSRP